MQNRFFKKLFGALFVFQLSALSPLGAQENTDGDKGVVVEKVASKKWALLVGVDEYSHVNDLQFCGQDVRGLKERLVDAGFRDRQIFLLHNKADEVRHLPFKANIETALELLLGVPDAEGKSLRTPGLVGKGDLVVVAFSGHGVHLDGTSYLCPAEARLQRSSSLISLERVYRQLSLCPADVKLLLVDACRNDPRPGGTKNLKATAGAKKFAASLESPPKGILVLSSCAPGQVSVEDETLGHGVFLNFVMDGLAGAADREEGNRNERVSLLELYRYAGSNTKLHVARTRSILQTPSLRGNLIGDFEFGRVTPKLKPGHVITNKIGMKLAYIPAGEFMMGSSRSAAEIARQFDSKAEYYENEHPQHRVRISQPFYLGTTEVTQGQWQAVMGTRPWAGESYVKEGRDYPATYVSWDDAVEFCRKLSAKEGVTYRLPTEAEWEYACRAGSRSMYSFGDDASQLGAYAWYDKNAWDVGERYAHIVGTKRANSWGLYDMHGNVYEWCSDWYDGDYYAGSPQTDPSGPASASFRVDRGGSWFTTARSCRSAFRNRSTPSNRFNVLGFRLARSSGSK